jgi:phosphoglycolate phosphatase
MKKSGPVAGRLSDYQHIIWDWNGTLFNDTALCVTIINTMLCQRALPTLSLDHYQAVFTFPVRDYYPRVGFDLSQESFEALSREFVTTYESRRHEGTLYPHTRRALEHVTASSKRQSLLSAYPQETLIDLVHTFELGHLFEHLRGLGHIYADSKIEQGQQLLSELPHHQSDVLLVGDTLHDAEVAQVLGTDCILIADGHQSKERLAQSGLPVVDSLEELF